MKKNLIILFVFILFSNPLIAKGTFKEIWEEKANYRITKLLAIDVNKNGIKEILFRTYSNYSTLHLIEWDGKAFINKWKTDYKKGVDFEYYAFKDFLLVKKFNPKKREVYPHTLLYRDGKYFLKETEQIKMPLWPIEKYILSGSFKERGAHDVIITAIYDEGMIEWFPRIRKAKPPHVSLWISPFKIYKLEGVQIFGDFDGDKKIELLLLFYYEEKGYLIYPKGDRLELKEIKSYRKYKDDFTLASFPLSVGNSKRYFKVGRTISKDFDELFFIKTSEIFDYGSLYKAVWQKNRFEFQAILYGRYNNLNGSSRKSVGHFISP